MWQGSTHNGCPAKYRCRPLVNAGEQIMKMRAKFADFRPQNVGDTDSPPL